MLYYAQRAAESMLFVCQSGKHASAADSSIVETESKTSERRRHCHYRLLCNGLVLTLTFTFDFERRFRAMPTHRDGVICQVLATINVIARPSVCLSVCRL